MSKLPVFFRTLHPNLLALGLLKAWTGDQTPNTRDPHFGSTKPEPYAKKASNLALHVNSQPFS